MKTFRFFGMALMAVLMCVNFTACGGGDDDEPSYNNGNSMNNGNSNSNGSNSNEENKSENENKPITKLLSSMVAYGVKYNFSYNDKKQLVSLDVETDWPSRKEFEWSDSQILITDVESGRYTHYQLKDGVITSIIKDPGDDELTYNLTYDNEKHLLKAYSAEEHTMEYEWTNGNINSFYDCDDLERTYIYDEEKENKHPVIDIDALVYHDFLKSSGDYLLMAHPNLLGNHNKNLIKSLTMDPDSDYEEIWNYTYEFDSDGYPTKIMVNGEIKYILLWE